MRWQLCLFIVLVPSYNDRGMRRRTFLSANLSNWVSLMDASKFEHFSCFICLLLYKTTPSVAKKKIINYCTDRMLDIEIRKVAILKYITSTLNMIGQTGSLVRASRARLSGHDKSKLGVTQAENILERASWVATKAKLTCHHLLESVW